MTKKSVIFLCSMILMIFYNFVLITNAESNDEWINYTINDENLYSETNTFHCKSIDKIVNYNLNERNSKKVSSEAPTLTILTHGLKSNASVWSNEKGKFTYSEDTLITRLVNSTTGANVYWYIMESPTRLKIIDLTAQNIKIKSGEKNEYSAYCDYLVDNNNNYRITDVSKPIIILFDAYDSKVYNDTLYKEFNYAVSKAVYDIQYLCGGVLPKINLIGHSRGGITNLQYAMDHPDLIDSIYSLGTPYLGSSSAQFDYDILGGKFGGGPGTGEESILDENEYLARLESWNNNYDSLYKNIKVYALGGYSSLSFLKYSLTSEYATKELGTTKSLLVSLLIDELEKIVSLYGYNNTVIDKYEYYVAIERIAAKIASYYSDENGIAAIADILLNETFSVYEYKYVIWYNDGLVDLPSQLGSKTINGINYEFKGFIRESFIFNLFNSDISKIAQENYSMVHNLEPRDKKMINYIIKNIEIKDKITDLYETYDVSSTEVGIRSIIGFIGSTELVIPDQINGKKVVEIGEFAFINNFNGNYNITSVILPNTIKKIGNNAFEKCEYLENIAFSSNLESIGDYAFYCCFNLEDVTIPSATAVIGDYAFLNCPNLTQFGYNKSTTYDVGQLNCLSEKKIYCDELYKGMTYYYNFNIECASYYDFNAIAGAEIKMWLYNSDLDIIFEETAVIDDGTNSTIIKQLEPGDYYLIVYSTNKDYYGDLEVIIDNRAAGRKELLVDTPDNVLEHLHNGHNEHFFMRNKTGFYEFILTGEKNGELFFPEGTITIFDDDNNVVQKFTIDNLNYLNSADSLENSNNLILCVEEYANYYIDVDIEEEGFTKLELLVKNLDEIIVEDYDYFSEEIEIIVGDRIKVLNMQRTGNYRIEVNYSGNQVENLLYIILKTDENNDFICIDKYLLNSENTKGEGDYTLNTGEKIYIGYFNSTGEGTISLRIIRNIKTKFELVTDPNENVTVGSEVSINNGDYGGKTLTQGYTRLCYLGIYAPYVDSRTEYNWYSSDEDVAIVSSFGTVTGTATWTDNVQSKSVIIRAECKYNTEIVGEITLTVYKDTLTEVVYLNYGMDVRSIEPFAGSEVTSGKGFSVPISSSPKVTIHKSYNRFICLGSDSPSNKIQDFDWTSNNENIAVVSQFGTITGNHTGLAIISGVYKYNPRFKVSIEVEIIT